MLIAKLDRLARNVKFIATMMAAGADFIACDQPFASRLTLHILAAVPRMRPGHILAAVAEDEARRISERTKAALQAAKAWGTQLGSPIAAQTAATARAGPLEVRQRGQRQDPQVIADIQASGVSTLAAIGKALEARGVRTPAGNDHWQPVQVSSCELSIGCPSGSGRGS